MLRDSVLLRSTVRLLGRLVATGSEPIEDLADRLGRAVEECCADRTETVHFVTHSMGGVIVRAYLGQRAEPHRGRVVMLAPPSQGSEVIDAFADSPLIRRILGPAALQLGTDSSGIATRLGAPRFELGIIAGDRSLNPLSSWFISGPDDGKVGVERA